MPSPEPAHAPRRVRLHLGCGSTVVPGWENIDKSPNVYLSRVPRLRSLLRRIGVLTEEQAKVVFPAGIVRADVRKGLPYSDDSAECVYTSHMIEHLSRWQALDLCRECRRILVPGGVLRIATPDLAALVRSYTAGEASAGPTSADSLMERLGTFRESLGPLPQRLIRRLATAPHQWLYDRESLEHLLREAGFTDISFRGFREGEMPDLDLLESERRADSLFAEARA